MAETAKPNIPDLGDSLQIKISNSHIAINDESKLFDGITSMQGQYGVVCMSTTNQSFIEFQVPRKCNLWAVGGYYSDSGGSSGKQIRLQKWDGTSYIEVGLYNTTNHYDWFLLFPNLEKGQYKITPTANYIVFNEWYVENLVFNKSLIELNGSEYRTYRSSGWNEIASPVTPQLFEEHGMTDLSIIPSEAWHELAQLSPTIEIVTYVPEGNKAKPFTETYMDIPLRIDMTALPFEQLIVQPSDFDLHGSLLSIVANKLPTQVYDGTCKFIVSFDKGAVWEAFRNGKWKTVNAADMENIREQGMSFKSLAHIKENHLSNKGKQIRIGYFLDDSIHREEEVKLDHSQFVVKSALDDVKLEDMTFHLLNTTAAIQLQLTGNKLTGKLDDPDKGKVQYRVLLNGKPYDPDNGEFTRLASSPVDINLYISEREILFNQENKLTVEFQDYWGQPDRWETTFIGTYSGLMFMDETGNYYSDTFGGILKYLDFGIIIAGQTTVDQKVVVKNQLGYEITNLTLESIEESLPQGVTIELSRSNKPFIAQDKLLYSQIFQQDDTVEFYVRIATVIEAEPTVNGQFEIRAKADRV
ncbi:hypothetical protein [Paenibacillus apiarius]|uniref:hypothetical protein n=1 Tax=Paenibacillus apiarius TaxID=46240 RepID=UPI00197D8D9E|nr:hypothetical protein [Paenibacillus apiarius]MBN3522260.1 hypothetical protein [Paenibacillus apiarius]